MNTYQFEVENARGTRDNECLLVEADDLEKAIVKAKRAYTERKLKDGMIFGLNLKIPIGQDMFADLDAIAQKNGGASFTTQISFNKTRVK